MTFPHDHHYLLDDEKIVINARRSRWVLLLTAVMMVAEIIAGLLTHSMALLADGWHMASHAAAMMIALAAYSLGSSTHLAKKLSFGAGKFIPLGGYSSALVLAIIALLMGVESVDRLLHPEAIQFNEAIFVAVIGLLVNLVSAWILGSDDHAHSHEHKHDHAHEQSHDHPKHSHDHNLRGAYIHVLADALTSVLAIIALLFGKYNGWSWMDPLMGVVGALVILKWAYGLCRDAGAELLDVHSVQLPRERVEARLKDFGRVLDLHVWRIAPNAIACELVVETQTLRGGDFYRAALKEFPQLKHCVIEERKA